MEHFIIKVKQHWFKFLCQYRQARLRQVYLSIDKAKQLRAKEIGRIEYLAGLEKASIHNAWEKEINTLYAKAYKVKQQMKVVI